MANHSCFLFLRLTFSISSFFLTTVTADIILLLHEYILFFYFILPHHLNVITIFTSQYYSFLIHFYFYLFFSTISYESISDPFIVLFQGCICHYSPISILILRVISRTFRNFREILKILAKMSFDKVPGGVHKFHDGHSIPLVGLGTYKITGKQVIN